jgi:hypothetical protein
MWHDAKEFKELKFAGMYITISAKVLDGSNRSGAMDEEDDVFCMLLPTSDIVRELFGSTKLSLLLKKDRMFSSTGRIFVYTQTSRKKFPYSS